MATGPDATADRDAGRPDAGRAGPQSVDRILGILELLAANDQAVGLAELARHLGAPKTSLVGLIAGLLQSGYLQRDGATAYRLGPRTYSLSMRVVGGLDIAVLARPVLEWLESQTHETSLLGALAPSGDVAMYIDKVESRSALRYTVSLGERRELHCSAIGKLLLAHMPERALSQYLKRAKLPRHTEATITSASALRRALHEVRHDGIARTRGELVTGASAIAAPVFGYQGELLFGLVVAGPTQRMDARGEHHANALRVAAQRLTGSMAGRSPGRTAG